MALNPLDSLVQERSQPGLGVAREVREGVPRRFGFLSDHVRASILMSTLLYLTGNVSFRTQAEHVLESVRSSQQPMAAPGM